MASPQRGCSLRRIRLRIIAGRGDDVYSEYRGVSSFERPDILIQAFARIAADFPDLDLVIIGNRGPAQVGLQSLVAGLELQERVRFYVDVPHPEVLACLAKATVFAFPSRSEGLPIAVLEAGLWEFRWSPQGGRHSGDFNSAEVGILVEADDAGALELALRRLLCDADQRARLGKHLQQRVVAEFTWERRSVATVFCHIEGRVVRR